VTRKASAASGKRTCASCGNGFIGGARASYCSPACKQRAHRSRMGEKGNAGRVTVTLPTSAGAAAHSPEAVALLAELDAELAENSAAHGMLEPLEFSAAERAMLESIARNVDRTVDLWNRYRASSDDQTRAKLSAELRLLETGLKSLLAAVKTDIPAPKSARAVHAAETRWRRGAD
jgi:hypothetical protein